MLNVDFEDIEIGEVFAQKGCWLIFYKTENSEAILLAEDHFSDFGVTGARFNRNNWLFHKCYRLPKSVQEMWLNN